MDIPGFASLRRNGLGLRSVGGGNARVRKEAASREEFGVEQSGAGCSAQQVVREQGQLYVEQRAFANAADGGGHAIAGVDVAARLRTIFFIEDDDGVFQGGRQRGEFVADGEIAEDFADFGKRGNFFQTHRDGFEVAVLDGYTVAVRADAEPGFDEARAIPFAEQLLRLGFHFFFFPTYEGNDIAENIERRDARIAGAGSGLHGNDEQLFEPESVGERLEHEDESGSGTIRIGDDEAGGVTAIFLLKRNRVEMRSVDFGNEQRDVGIHSMVFGVAHDAVACPSEVFFGGTGDGRVERRENEIAIEGWFKTFDAESGGSGGDGFVKVPLRGFGVFFPGRTFGGGDFGEFKPRVTSEKLDRGV